MKIIDADKLHYKTVRIATAKGIKPALVVFAKEIQKMPEIVRCKDCKFGVIDGVKYFCSIDGGIWCDGDWFCADGEMRENDKSIRA